MLCSVYPRLCVYNRMHKHDLYAQLCLYLRISRKTYIHAYVSIFTLNRMKAQKTVFFFWINWIHYAKYYTVFLIFFGCIKVLSSIILLNLDKARYLALAEVSQTKRIIPSYCGLLNTLFKCKIYKQMKHMSYTGYFFILSEISCSVQRQKLNYWD